MKLPMQVILRSAIEAGRWSEGTDIKMETDEVLPPSQVLKAAMIVICTVPILVICPFIQKYFVKGMLVGSVKG